MMLCSDDGGQQQSLLETVINTIRDGLIVLDLDYNIVLANRCMEGFHHSELPLTGKKCYAVFHKRQEPCDDCPYARTMSSGQPHTRLFRYDFEDDRTGWYEITVYRIEDADGSPLGAIEHTSNVTKRESATDQLRDEINRRRMMVDQSRDGIVIIDQNGDVYETNERFARMLGYSVEEVYQLQVFDWEVAHPKDVVLEMLAAVDGDGDHFETRHKRKDGTLLEVEISSNGAVYDGKKLVFCVCRDVTDKKDMERRIGELAIRDCLTEVYNRRYVFERLAEMVAEYSRNGSGFCVSILDIDHFKTVNDIHGHQAGDFALKEFTQTIVPMVRQYDLLGRYGGEEFIIVSRTAAAWETVAMLERIMDTVRHKAFVFDGREIRFTFSCGLADSAEFAREELSLEAVISLADERLYDAKAAGRNRCVGPVGLPHGCFEPRTSSILSNS